MTVEVYVGVIVNVGVIVGVNVSVGVDEAVGVSDAVVEAVGVRLCISISDWDGSSVETFGNTAFICCCSTVDEVFCVPQPARNIALISKMRHVQKRCNRG